jgi:tRNA:m4X modification enzyme
VEGEKGLGHGAVASKNFLASAAATAVAVVAAASEGVGAAGQVDDKKGKKGRDWRDKGSRIPCPHDPRHSIYEKDLQHHLNNCPMYKQKQVIMAQPFYSENINVGLAGGQEEVDDDEAEDEEERLRKGEELPKFKTLLGDLQAEVDMRAFAALVHEVFVNVVGDIRTELLLPSALREAQALAKEREAAAGSAAAAEQEAVGRRKWNNERHEEQQRSIIGHMEKTDMLNPNYVYVEMGAGRGTLSRTLREAEPACHIVLVERGSQRNKVDPKMSLDGSATGTFARARIDIAHLNLRKLPAIQGREVVLTGRSVRVCKVNTAGTTSNAGTTSKCQLSNPQRSTLDPNLES